MSSLTNCWNLRVTAEVNQGGRRYMEDVTSVQFERAKAGNKVLEFACFAIFDGHGGKEAAHFARDYLLENIKKNRSFFSNDVDSVKKAIHDGFLATHQAMWQKLPNWPKTSNGHPSTAGTTASVVILRGNKMYVANVGDSMVVMGSREHYERNNPQSFRTMELTVDHKPELETERERINNCGGCVMNKSGVNRVVWNRPKLSHTGPIRRSTRMDKIPFLAIARSLGDLWSFNSELNEFVVSPTPDVYMYDLHQQRDQFIVLASDGLWNMVRPSECVNQVAQYEERKKRGEVSDTPAHMLVQLALNRWNLRNMRADNTSVIVVFIERRNMKKTIKTKGTYSESWTSARINGGAPDHSSPMLNDLAEPGVPVPPPAPTIYNEPIYGPPPMPPSAADSTTGDLLQDSSISSSSGDVEPECSNTVDEPVSSSTRKGGRPKTMPAIKRRQSEGPMPQGGVNKRRKTSVLRRRSEPVKIISRRSKRLKAKNSPKK